MRCDHFFEYKIYEVIKTFLLSHKRPHNMSLCENNHTKQIVVWKVELPWLISIKKKKLKWKEIAFPMHLFQGTHEFTETYDTEQT